MKLTITGRHTEVSKELKLYIRKRFEKWSTFLPPEATVHVILTVEGYRNTAEVTATSKQYSVTGKQMSKDMFSAVDLLTEKIGSQLARQHERLLSTKNGSVGGRRRGPALERPGRDAAEPGRITAVEAVGGKPMTREEAALELQAMRQPFLVFEEAETGDLAVLVRRKDGNFTLYVRE